MAATITEGLNGIARSVLSGLQKRIEALRQEAEKQLKVNNELQFLLSFLNFHKVNCL